MINMNKGAVNNPMFPRKHSTEVKLKVSLVKKRITV